MAPRLLLQVLHEGTRLAVESSPPASCSMRWSACVALLPQPQWQSGLPSSIAALFVRYCWVVFLLPAMSVILLAPLASPAVALLCAKSLGCLCPPHFTAVRCWLPDCLGWTPYAFCVVRELCTGDLPQQPFTLSHLGWLGAPALPTFPCEHQQSAIPYVALVVISCVLATCVCLE